MVKKQMNIDIEGESFEVTVATTDEEVVDRSGNITPGVNLTFNPDDTDRLNKAMNNWIKPGDFSVGFDESYTSAFKNENI